MSIGAAYFGITPRRPQDFQPRNSQDFLSADELYGAPSWQYNPVAEQDAYNQGQAQGQMGNLDLETLEGVSGLQRLLGQGAVTPQQATSMIGAQRALTQVRRENDRHLIGDTRAAYAKIAALDPTSPDYFDTRNQVINEHFDSIADPRVARLLNEKDRIGTSRGVMASHKDQQEALREKLAMAGYHSPEDLEEFRDSEGNLNKYHVLAAVNAPKPDARQYDLLSNAMIAAQKGPTPQQIENFLMDQQIPNPTPEQKDRARQVLHQALKDNFETTLTSLRMQGVRLPPGFRRMQGIPTQQSQPTEIPTLNSPAEIGKMGLQPGQKFYTPDGQLRTVK